MIKMHAEFDIKIMEETGNNYNDFVDNLVTKVLPKADLMIEEKDDNGYLLIKGPNKNTDLAYLGLLANAFRDNDFTKKSLKKLLLLTNRKSEDSSFYIEGDWIETWKENNMW